MSRRRRAPETSWERVADWYRGVSGRRGPELLVRIVYPEVFRLLGPLSGHRILDAGCGTGALARKLAARGADVIGIDVSPQAIEIARRDAKEAGVDPPPEFDVADAHDPGAFPASTLDAVTLVLSLQNMEGPETVLRNAAQGLRPDGRLVIALHHPAFRIPGSTHWGWDPDRETQFRRVDRYRTPHRVQVRVEGRGEPPFPTFHWPLERLFSALRGAGFVVVDLAEPVGDAPREPRKRSAETRARQEIPLFLILLARRKGGRPRRTRRTPRG